MTLPPPEPVDDAMGEDPPEEEPYFDSDYHALHVGFLIGALAKSGFKVVIVTDAEGNYTADLEVSVPTFDDEDDLDPIVVAIRVMG